MTSPATQEPCQNCDGTGKIHGANSCCACKGTGRAPPSQRAELLTQELESALRVVKAWANSVALPDYPKGKFLKADEAAALLQHIAALEQRVAELANDRSAKTKRMWELGHECDRLAARVEAADKLADAASAYNTQKLLWKPAHWSAVAEALSAYRALSQEPRNG